MQIPDTIMTSGEVARLLRIGYTKLWQLRMQGSIGHFRVGKLVRFKPEHVKQFISKNERTVTENGCEK